MGCLHADFVYLVLQFKYIYNVTTLMILREFCLNSAFGVVILETDIILAQLQEKQNKAKQGWCCAVAGEAVSKAGIP